MCTFFERLTLQTVPISSWCVCDPEPPDLDRPLRCRLSPARCSRSARIDRPLCVKSIRNATLDTVMSSSLVTGHWSLVTAHFTLHTVPRCESALVLAAGYRLPRVLAAPPNVALMMAAEGLAALCGCCADDDCRRSGCSARTTGRLRRTCDAPCVFDSPCTPNKLWLQLGPVGLRFCPIVSLCKTVTKTGRLHSLTARSCSLELGFRFH